MSKHAAVMSMETSLREHRAWALPQVNQWFPGFGKHRAGEGAR